MAYNCVRARLTCLSLSFIMNWYWMINPRPLALWQVRLGSSLLVSWEHLHTYCLTPLDRLSLAHSTPYINLFQKPCLMTKEEIKGGEVYRNTKSKRNHRMHSEVSQLVCELPAGSSFMTATHSVRTSICSARGNRLLVHLWLSCWITQVLTAHFHLLLQEKNSDWNE